MKKSVILAFGFIVILSSWWAVNNITRPQFEAGVLDVWVTWAEDPEQLQTLFARYHQTDDQPVEVTTGIKGNKVLGAINNSTTPDVVILSSADLVKAYDQQELIEPLNAWIETTGIDLDDFYPAALAQCTTPDGTILCLPLSSDIDALFWNKDLFEVAGLDPEQPPQTMEELVTYAAQLTIRNTEGKLEQLGFIPNFSRSHLDLYTRMFGGSLINDNGTELKINTEPVVDAIRWQQQFYEKYGPQDIVDFVSSLNRYANSSHPVYAGERLNCQQCHRYPPKKSAYIPDHGFYNGQVAMMVNGVWQVGANYIPSFQPNLNYGIAPFPASTDHPEWANTTVVQSAVIAIPAGAQDKSAAAQLLAWIMSPEILAEVMYNRGSLPASREAIQDIRFQQVPNFDIFIELLNHANARPTITTAVTPELNEALGQVETDVLYEREDPVQLLDALQMEFAPKLQVGLE